MISVLVADDHTILRQGLVSLLSKDENICGHRIEALPTDSWRQ